MKELFFILIIIGILLLIYRRISKKGKGPGCGIICQLLQKPSLPKKLKTYKESKQEARETIKRTKKEKERK